MPNGPDTPGARRDRSAIQGSNSLTGLAARIKAEHNARDAAIAFSFAVQDGAGVEAIRRALSRDSNENATGPLGRTFDIITEGTEGRQP